MKRPVSLKMKFSSGGVIFKRNSDAVDVALISIKGGTVWGLPKGIISRGEKSEDTALREVKEETGIQGRLIDKIGDISFWYYAKAENTRYKKTVSYYLLEFVSGSTDEHDHEVEAAEWFPIDTAIERVSYKGDREILAKAREMITVLAGNK